jgi:hypothetical protein
MKMLWQKVIPMMRCWHVLVPLKEADGYDGKLEVMAARPGLLLDQERRVPGAHEDGVCPALNSSMLQFDPP